MWTVQDTEFVTDSVVFKANGTNVVVITCKDNTVNNDCVPMNADISTCSHYGRSSTGCKGWWTRTLELSVILVNKMADYTILHDKLHWLNVHERIEYKLGVMVYWCLHDQVPLYLADHIIPASDAAPRRLRLRSANLNRLTVPRCRFSTYSSRAFYHAGPTVRRS